MAYYAALVTIVELLQETRLSEHQYPKSLFHKQQIIPLYEAFSHLQELLEDHSPNDKEVDSILETGYRDWEIVKAEVDFVVIEGYQKLVKFKEEFEVIVGFKSQTLQRVKEEIDFIVGRGYQDLKRVKEKVDFVVEKGYTDHFNKVREVVDSIVEEKGYQCSERVKEEIDPVVGQGYRERTKEEVDSIVIKGYQDLSKLKEELDVIIGVGHQDLERVKEVVDSIVEKGHKVLFEKVKEEVDSIVKDLKRIKEKSHTTHQDDLQVGPRGSVSTQGRSDGTTMVGFEQHLTTLKAQLVGDSSRLEVISIVGMGGIGKTTLARNIFDDELIDYHFDLCVWVTVSQNYYLRKILLAIANSLNINNEESHGGGEYVLKERIYKHLFGRRYLIIMDDVWDTKIWDDIKKIVPKDDETKSPIIITTRQLDVASLAGESVCKNKIPILEYDQSWDLFCRKEDIGRSIVKHCRGLPLASVVVAGLLSKVNKTKGMIGKRLQEA